MLSDKLLSKNYVDIVFIDSCHFKRELIDQPNINRPNDMIILIYYKRR